MFLENLKLAFANMVQSKLRTFLSLLGIVIGVGSVVAIMNLGQSVKESITSSMNLGGADIITVSPVDSRSGVFDEELASSFSEYVPGAEGAAATVRTSGIVRYGKETSGVTINGVTSSYFGLMGAELLYGSFFTEDDCITRSQTIVLGYDAAKKLFPAGDAVGKYVSLYRNQSKKYLVVGVLEDGSDSIFSNYNGSAFIPYNTFTSRLKKTTTAGSYVIKAKEGEDVSDVKSNVEAFLSKIASPDDYTISASAEISNMTDTVMGYLTMFLAVIAGISLIVGGIGIMNIMLVTVVERTREIGIRKALGATPKAIRRQFLVESTVLSLFGGVFGALFGLLVSFIISKGAGWNFVVSPSSIVLALAFSSAVGIFFGSYPAAKAAALDPIDALAYE